MTLQVFDIFVVRLKSLAIQLATIATIIMAHMDLLHLTTTQKDIVMLVCLIIVGLTRPPVYVGEKK
uniref:Uncharacterized protein n=1 Tax=viral metagenome TaxID=1070528 RepID=A0A6M3LCP8_9ZZZZ